MTHPISFVYLSHFILGRINPIALKMCSNITVAFSFKYLFITYLELGLHKSDVVFSLLLSTSHPSIQNLLRVNGVLEEKETYFSLYCLYFLNFYYHVFRLYHLKVIIKNESGTFPAGCSARCCSLAHRSVPEPNGMTNILCVSGSRSTQIP